MTNRSAQRTPYHANTRRHTHAHSHMDQDMYKYAQKAEGESAGESDGLLLKEYVRLHSFV